MNLRTNKASSGVPEKSLSPSRNDKGPSQKDFARRWRDNQHPKQRINMANKTENDKEMKDKTFLLDNLDEKREKPIPCPEFGGPDLPPTVYNNFDGVLRATPGAPGSRAAPGASAGFAFLTGDGMLDDDVPVPPSNQQIGAFVVPGIGEDLGSDREDNHSSAFVGGHSPPRSSAGSAGMDFALPGFAVPNSEEIRRSHSYRIRQLITNAPLVPSQPLGSVPDQKQELSTEKLHRRCMKFVARFKCAMLTVLGLAVLAVVSATVAVLVTRPDGTTDRTPVSMPASSNNSLNPELTSLPMSDRFRQIRTIVTSVSNLDELLNESSAQFNALLWLSDLDEARIGVNLTERLLQRYAVAVFFFSTGGEDYWLDRFNFLSPEHECLWDEVYCDKLFDAVDANGFDAITGMRIGANNMKGTLPEELSALSELKFLLLSNNGLSGSIPDAIGALTKLRLLDLGYNQIGSTIPSSLFKLKKMQTLRLIGNELTGQIPEFGNMSGLSMLHLGMNHFSGMVPVSINSLSNLELLFAAGNMLGGSLPVLHLPRLFLIDLAENFFSGSLSFVENLVSLSTMNLASNQFSGAIPDLGGLQLETCILFKNNLTSIIPQSIFEIDTLKILSLGHNHLHGFIDIPKENFQDLIAVGLEGNELSGTIPDIEGPKRNLVALSLHSNHFYGVIPDKLGTCTGLVLLELSNNHLSGTLPESFGQLTNLMWFSVARNNVTGSINHVCKARTQNGIVIADCAPPQPEVDCDCCSPFCCSDGLGNCNYFFPLEAYVKRCIAEEQYGGSDASGSCPLPLDFVWH